MRFIVTVRLPKNPEHDPKNKVWDRCPFADHLFCTDSTGEHHSTIEEGDNFIDIRKRYEKAGYHVTRIERVRD